MVSGCMRCTRVRGERDGAEQGFHREAAVVEPTSTAARFDVRDDFVCPADVTLIQLRWPNMCTL